MLSKLKSKSTTTLVLHQKVFNQFLLLVYFIVLAQKYIFFIKIPSIGLTKLLVAQGQLLSGGYTTKVEIFDLDNTNSTCSYLPADTPYQLKGESKGYIKLRHD
jgi:hypothetical protein